MKTDHNSKTHREQYAKELFELSNTPSAAPTRPDTLERLGYKQDTVTLEVDNELLTTDADYRKFVLKSVLSELEGVDIWHLQRFDIELEPGSITVCHRYVSDSDVPASRNIRE
jgi:hypothetical protein